jgi:Tol biopolymer transport system component
VSKEELLARAWPDSFVEEANLSHHIFRLRRALGEDSDEKFIETVPKRGYRFMAAAVQHSAGLNAGDTAIDLNGHVHPKPAVLDHNWHTRYLLASSLILIFLTAMGFAAYRLIFVGDGGLSRPVADNFPRMTTIPLTSFPNDEFDSALSPDGKYTAFAWYGTDNESLQIYVKQTDAGEPLRLTTNAARDRDGAPAWSPDGRFIAYSRMSSDQGRSGIYVVPSLGGAERRLVRVAILGAGLDWSADGRTLVFSSKASQSEPLSLQLLDFETLETRPLTFPPAQSEGDVRPDFTPDGQNISFTRRLQESGDLYLTDLAGGMRRLTSDNRSVIGAAWAPDGKSIIFSSNRGGAFSLWRLDKDDIGGITPLAINAERAFDPSISRSGNRLTFTQIQRDTNIWRVPTRKANHPIGPGQVIASSRRELTPSYSPDGAKIAYASDISGSYEIWTSNVDGSAPIQLTKFGGGMTINPHWSPNGTNIAFDARPDGLSEIYISSLNGGTPRRLSSGIANNAAASFSADGEWVYYSSDLTGAWEIWKMPVGGGDAEQVTRNGGLEAFESQDGQKLYFIKSGIPGVFELSPGNPGEENLLIPAQAFESYGEWTVAPDGIYLAQHHYETASKRAAIEFFSFETGKIKTILELDKDFGSYPGINASPDGQWLIFSREDVRNHDISLVENFR